MGDHVGIPAAVCFAILLLVRQSNQQMLFRLVLEQETISLVVVVLLLGDYVLKIDPQG